MVDQTKRETKDNSEIVTFPTVESGKKATIASRLNKQERERIHSPAEW